MYAQYKYRVGQIVRLNGQNLELEIVGLGTTKDMYSPIYFFHAPNGDGAKWAFYEHEIEAA